MRKFIIPIQFIVVMLSLAFSGYAEEPKEKITNSLGMELLLIQPGQFMMGSPEDEPGRYTGERPHRVNLTKPFYMQTTEVTQAQWQALMGKNPSSHKRCGLIVRWNRSHGRMRSDSFKNSIRKKEPTSIDFRRKQNGNMPAGREAQPLFPTAVSRN